MMHGVPPHMMAPPMQHHPFVPQPGQQVQHPQEVVYASASMQQLNLQQNYQGEDSPMDYSAPPAPPLVHMQAEVRGVAPDQMQHIPAQLLGNNELTISGHPPAPDLCMNTRPIRPEWRQPPPPRGPAPGGPLRRPRAPAPLAPDRMRQQPPAAGGATPKRPARILPSKGAAKCYDTGQANREMLRAFRRQQAPQEISLGEGIEGSAPFTTVDQPGDERRDFYTTSVRDFLPRIVLVESRSAKYYKSDNHKGQLWRRPVDPQTAPEILRRKLRSFVVTVTNVGKLSEYCQATLAAHLGQQPSSVVRVEEKDLGKEDLLAKGTVAYRELKQKALAARNLIVDEPTRESAWLAQLVYFRVSPAFDWADVIHNDDYYHLKNYHRWDQHVSAVEEIICGKAKITIGIPLKFDSTGIINFNPLNRRWDYEDIRLKRKVLVFRDRPDRQPRPRTAEYDPLKGELTFAPGDEANLD